MAMNILAVPTDQKTARACLDAAAAAAKVDPTSRIIVLHVHTDPASLILPTEEVLTERRREALERAASRRAQAIRAVFDDWEPGAGVRVAWDEVVGAEQTEVVSHAKAAALVVVARPLDHEGRETLRAAIFEADCLLLYVPSAPPPRFGAHIAIAWKECDAAKAAVAAALPWLKKAARVTVLQVGADVAPDPPRALLDMLERDGVKAEAVLVASNGEDVGARLLEQAHAIGADSVVMGAYRHGELIERLLGGVTRHMLQAADLPVFLHH